MTKIDKANIVRLFLTGLGLIITIFGAMRDQESLIIFGIFMNTVSGAIGIKYPANDRSWTIAVISTILGAIVVLAGLFSTMR